MMNNKNAISQTCFNLRTSGAELCWTNFSESIYTEL